MNDTLKAAGRIGAELGAAKAEVVRLREALHAIDRRNDSMARFDSEINAIVRAALSPQAEPTETYTAVDMATAAAQGFRDGQAATVKDFLTVQPMAYAVFAANGNVVCFSTRRDHPSLVALEADGHSVVSLTRPAQTEQQQPDIACRLCGKPTVCGKVLCEACAYAPIAQTAPQGKFRMGDLVKKSTGSEWEGRVVGWYSTEQTKEGYAVESSAHRNSVQIYPVTALEEVE